jgi:LysR family transcriptional regulator for metE and metH
VDVDIAVDATRRPIDALLANEIDLAVLTAAVSDRRILVRPLFVDEILVVVGRKHRFAYRTHVEVADLATEHLIVYKTDRRDSYIFNTILEPVGVEPARVSQVPLTEAIIEMVKAGLGVAILARWAVEPAIKSGGVRISRRGLMRQWCVATLRGRTEPAWQSDFIALLRERAPATGA